MPDGLPLVRRMNALLAEKDLRIATAGGWLTATDPAWREDWKARKDALIADVRAHEQGRNTMATDSYHSATDSEWFLTYSANELIFAHDEESPVLTTRHALRMLLEHFGADHLKALIDAESP